MSEAPDHTWVFHRGALGDSVILWPILRAIDAAGVKVTLVTDRSKGALAEREIGIKSLDIEQPRFHQMWIPLGLIEPEYDVGRVFSFHADGRRGVWLTNARRAFPKAIIRIIDHRPDQRLIRPFIMHRDTPWESAGEKARYALFTNVPGAIPDPRPNLGGPVVIHVGAGSEEKRWPLERWTALAAALRARGHTVHLLAGEVESERFSAGERLTFSNYNGRVLWSLEELADTIRAASLYVGADSGPAHLAAALGVRTAVLFGPTDTRRWMPLGPWVFPLAPGNPVPMAQIRAEDIIVQVVAMLDQRAARRGTGGR